MTWAASWRKISSPSGISRVMIATAASRSITLARSRGLPSILTAIAAFASPGPIAAAISAPVTGPANSRRLPSGRVTAIGAGPAGLSGICAAEDWWCIVPLREISKMSGLAEAPGCDNHVTLEAACFKPPARLPKSLRRPFVAPIALYPPLRPWGRRGSVGGREAAWMCQLGPWFAPTSCYLPGGTFIGCRGAHLFQLLCTKGREWEEPRRRPRPTITSGSIEATSECQRRVRPEENGCFFGIAGSAIPAHRDPVCGIAHTKIFSVKGDRRRRCVLPLRARRPFDQEQPPGSFSFADAGF